MLAVVVSPGGIKNLIISSNTCFMNLDMCTCLLWLHECTVLSHTYNVFNPLVYHLSFSHLSTICTTLPPGKAPLSQRSVRSLAGPSPPPGTWRPVHLQPAGTSRSCRRPTGTRWASRWSAASHSTPCSPGRTGDTSDRQKEQGQVEFRGQVEALIFLWSTPILKDGARSV